MPVTRSTAPLLLTLPLLAVCRAPAAHAQPPAPTPAAQAVPLPDPASIAVGLGKAALTRTVAERVTVTIREPAPTGNTSAPSPPARPAPARRDEFTLRTRPLPTPPGATPDLELALDLGPLHVFASAGFLVVTHAARPETFFRHDYDPPLTPARLAAVLRPLPLPHLSLARLAADPNANPALPFDLTPFTPRVLWQTGTAEEPADRPAVITLEGRSEHGPVTLVADAKTSRLRRLTGTLPGGATLELTFQPEPPAPPTPSDPAATPPPRWEPNLAGRRLVPSLPELLRADAPVAVGQRLPTALANPLTLDRARLNLRDLFTPAAQGQPATSHALILLIRAGNDAQASFAVATAAAAAVAPLLKDHPSTRPVLHLALDQGPGLTDAALAAAQTAAAGIPADFPFSAALRCWSTPRAATLGRIPGATRGAAGDQSGDAPGVAVLVVDADLVVRVLEVLDTAEDAARLGERLDGHLGEPAPPSGPVPPAK